MGSSDYRARYAGTRVLVTGGLGFIGSNLAHALVEAGAHVTLVDNLLEGGGANLFNIRDIAHRLELCKASIADTGEVASRVAEARIVFNLAAQTGHLQSMRKPLDDAANTAIAQLAFLEICRRHGPNARIIYASTRQVYGRHCGELLTEESPTNPVDLNSLHHLTAERYHRLYHQHYGLSTAILRLVTYGPRQAVGRPSSGVLGEFIRQAVDGGELQVFGTGTLRRDILYVDDVVDAFLRCGASDLRAADVFNLASASPVSLQEIAETLVRLAGRGSWKHALLPLEMKPLDVGECLCSSEKIQRVLGWSPRVDLEAGLGKALAFFSQNKDYYWEDDTISGSPP